MTANNRVVGEQQQTVLSVQHIKKKIGKKWIVQDVTFEVKAGEIFGFWDLMVQAKQRQ